MISTLGFFLSLKTKMIFVPSTMPYIAKKNTQKSQGKKLHGDANVAE